MRVFDTKNTGVSHVENLPFKLEKEIQSIVEKNSNTFLGLEFVRSEFTLGEFRIDTLCFNHETNSFVIIEYKRGSNYSVIDQGYSYLSLMINNKSDFIIEYNEKLNKNLRRDEIDWTQSKVVFISQNFTNYQRNSVNFKNLPFELWEIKRFKNNTIILNQILSSSKENIKSITNSIDESVLNTVSKEVQIIDEDFHVSKLDDETKEKWIEFKDRLLQLDNISIEIIKNYISFKGETKKLCYAVFRKNYISLEFLRGNINPDGTTSKTFFHLEDPKKISTEGSWEWKSGVRGNIYKIRVDKSSDIDYLMFLVNQKYKNILNEE